MQRAMLAGILALVGLDAAAHASDQERRLLLAEEAKQVGHAIAGGGRPSAKWEVDLDVILWLPISMNGTSTVNGITVPMNFDLDDILNLLEIGGQARAEVWRGRWGFIVDASYMSLGTEGSIPLPGPGGPSFEVDVQQWNVDFAAAYRALKTEEQNTTIVDAILGGRYVDLKQTVDIATPPGTRLGGSSNWAEIFVGVRFATMLSESWSLMIRGDIGGFGIGTGSELTWNILFAFGYQFGKERRPGRHAYGVKFGWRVYDIEYLRGSPNNAFGMDALIHGPFFSFTFQF